MLINNTQHQAIHSVLPVRYIPRTRYPSSSNAARVMLQQKQSLYIHGIFKWLILILQCASFLGRMKQNVHMYL